MLLLLGGNLLQSARSAVTGVPPPGSKELRILDGMSGVLRPQRLALLLGPPGSGKTTLLRALAGQNLRDKSLKVGAPWLSFIFIVSGQNFAGQVT